MSDLFFLLSLSTIYTYLFTGTFYSLSTEKHCELSVLCCEAFSFCSIIDFFQNPKRVLLYWTIQHVAEHSDN